MPPRLHPVVGRALQLHQILACHSNLVNTLSAPVLVAYEFFVVSQFLCLLIYSWFRSFALSVPCFLNAIPTSCLLGKFLFILHDST